MADVAHQWGSDLAAGPTGDFVLADGSALAQQRVLRRLLTNPGDYIWQLDYGAGLGRFVGDSADAARIQAVIRSQIFKEEAVAATPEPVIDVQIGAGSVVYVHLRYVDAASRQTQLLSFSVNG